MRPWVRRGLTFLIGVVSLACQSLAQQPCHCTIWDANATPTFTNLGPYGALEVGVKFRTDTSGLIAGIRFYKSSLDTGTHIGNLWTSSGTLLASATFTGETATGWQQVNFATPVLINANTVYVASYHTDVGSITYDYNYFEDYAGGAVDSPPLHALGDGDSGDNGVYIFSSSSAFPTTGDSGANYWVDVVFESSPPPAPVSIAIAPSNPSVTEGQGQQFKAVATYSDSSTQDITPLASWSSANPSLATISTAGAATSFGIGSVAISATVGGVTGTTTLNLQPSAVACPCTIWDNSATPANTNLGPYGAIEAGVKFTADVNGLVTGVRFYKSSSETGTHVADLWSSSGALLATTTFAGETDSGWQEADFSAPVAITANTTYVAAYHSDIGYLSFDYNYFQDFNVGEVHRFPLRGLSDAESGGNGVYVYSSTSTFPTNSYSGGNFWADVVFTPNTGGGAAPSITSISPSSGPVGTPITIMGSNFGSPQGASTITFNGVVATATSWGVGSIVVPVPAGATSGNVAVTVNGVVSNGATFTVGSTSIQLVGTPVNGYNGGTGLTETLNYTGATAGNFLVVYGNGGDTDCSSLSLSDTGTGTIVSGPTITSPNPGPAAESIWGVCNVGAGAHNLTVTAAGCTGDHNVSARVEEWQGISTNCSGVLDQSAAQAGGIGLSVTSPLVTTTQPRELAVGLGNADTTNFWTSNGNWIDGGRLDPSNYNHTQNQLLTSISTLNTDLTLRRFGYWTGLLATWKASSVPTITGLSPSIAPIGSAVTIAGVNFGTTQGTSTVTFSGQAATATSWSDAQLVVAVPAGASTGPVTVTVGGSPSNAFSFTVIPTPHIDDISPSFGPVGTAVTITGENFSSAQGVSTVTFNGTAATSTSWNDTSIVVPVPTSTTSGNVIVTVGGYASNSVSFTVIVPPHISSVSPGSGAVGSSVTITGTSFGSTQGSSIVSFNGVLATPTSWSATSIAVPVPMGATTGNIVVTVGTFASNGAPFTVTSSSGPQITNLAPAVGPSGTSVTISGSNFGSTQGTSTIRFNGLTASVSSWSASAISATVPASATTGNVLVIVGGLSSNGVLFTVGSVPSISGLSPSSGTIGTSVTISGSNFGTSPAQVFFNGVLAAPTGWSSTSITVPVPVGATTGNVVVNVAGIGSAGSLFTVSPTGGTPNINHITPTAGLAGTGVSIYGSNFGNTQGTSSVTFNGTSATTTYWSPGLIVALVPNGATSGNIVVSAGGQSSNGVAFTVGAVPTINYLSPSAGPVGQIVTISGSNFGGTQGTSTVSFNGTVGTPTSWSATSITVPAPSGTTSGPVTVTVGGIVSSGIAYTVLPGVTSLSPTLGGSGTAVTVTGTGFGATQGASTLTLGNMTVTPTSWSDTAIGFTVPSGAISGYVSVTVNSFSTQHTVASYFDVGSAPTVTSISPSSGPVGMPVTVTGTNFGTTSYPASGITFNGVAAQLLTWSNTSITAAVPIGATTGNIVVTVGGASTSGNSFTVTSGPGITALSQVTGGLGEVISIYGNNFGMTQGTSTITFNGTTATPASWSDTYLLVPVPSSATSGPVAVTVGGTSSNNISFTVTTNPTISYISPNPARIGASVTIAGSSFGTTQGTSTVTFNGNTASPTAWSMNSIVVAVPSGASTGNVVVTVGGTASAGVNFRIDTSPNIVGVAPLLALPGTSVTITGAAFGASQGSSTVTFNGIGATATSWSDTSITATVPTGATTGYLVVTVGGATSNYVLFNVGSTPTIASLSASSGPVGLAVTIAGANFGVSRFNSTVTFNGTAATYISWSDASIAVIVPNATSGNIVVTVGGVSSSGAPFTITSGPGISRLSAATGAPTAAVLIYGSGFGLSQGSSTVAFNGTAAPVTSWSDTLIQTSVPSGATSGNVVVTVTSLSSNGVPFTVVPVPTITSVSPSASPSGSSITITGSHFGTTTNAGFLQFSVSSGISVVADSWSDSSIVARAQSNIGLISGVLTVTTYASNVKSNAVPFTILPVPSIASFTPTSGPAGTVVTITGSSFGSTQGYSTIAFNGGTGTPTAWSDTSVTVPVPHNAATGQVFVTVNGVTGSGGGSFTVTPHIDNLSPSTAAANTPLAINGSGFGDSLASVSFFCSGGIQFTCSGCGAAHIENGHPSSWTREQILLPVPSVATTGPVDVVACNVFSNTVTLTVPTGSTGTVTGGVGRLLDGSPIAGASVAALQSGSTIATTASSPDGLYHFDSLAAGSYDMRASAAGYVTATSTGIAVTAGNNTVASFSLAGTPVVSLLTPNWGPTSTTVTIAGSNFGASQLGSTVTFNGTSATPTSWSDTSIVVPVPSGATSGSVVVTVGGVASTGLTFSVGSGTLTGTVTSASTSAAVSGALVEALQGNVAKASATSGSGGTYTISNLAPGTYDVRVSASSYGTLISAGNTVGVGSPTTVNAALPNAGTDSGKVTQSNGTTAIVGAIVTALQGGIAVSSATTDSSGNFSIANLSAGTYLVQAAAAGYTTQLTPGISVTAGSTTTTNFSLPGQSTITYAYDDLGRLTGVVDSQNGSATYHYDAVGNITAIDRATASQISISSFSPIKASVGSTVTINGNNFSATSSSDTLTFNGTSATITSASTTQLIVTVPTGATTGTISVTSPAGSATSSQSFTVTTAAGSPTITGISPTTAVAGNSLSVTGTNFDSTASHDTAVLNTLSAITSSASTTSLSVTVPSTATTGKLRVTTPRGSAASTGYVFVPSSGHVASDVSNTYQLTSLPATQTVQISTANKMAILAFDGVAGQRVTLKTSNSTFANGCGVPGTLYSPSGAALFNHGCIGNNNVFMDATLLPSTGTYALHLGPDTTTTGQVDIAVGSVNPDVTGQLVINGSSAPVTIATWGQNAFFTFNGTAGQSATVHITSNTVPGMNVYLYSPQGTQLASTQAAGSSFNLAQVTLPITGSYLIKIDPNGGSQYTGALNVSVTSP